VSPPSEKRVVERAAAYDDVYARWTPKRVTVESFERWARFVLRSPPGEPGHSEGNEIEWALRLLDVDHLAGKQVLDCCCGTGLSSIYFALKGATVEAFDASARAVEVARESARISGVSDRVRVSVQDAQRLDYTSGSFDLGYCQSALHILVDYPRCAGEIARVLKPGGKIVFCEEPLGYNPLLAAVRWWRRRRFRPCGGRTLSYRDLRRFGEPFGLVRVRHFNLFSQVRTLLGERVHAPWVKAALRRAYAADEWLLEHVPPLRPLAGKVVVEYVNARREVGPSAPSSPAGSA
jgi:SAM-dependent methyltransferase